MTSFVETFNRTADAWWPFVFHAAWQAALVGIVVLLILKIGKRWPAPIRYGLVLVALIKFVTPPMMSLPFGILSQFHLASPAESAPPANNDAVIVEESAEAETSESLQVVRLEKNRTATIPENGGMQRLIDEASKERTSDAKSVEQPATIADVPQIAQAKPASNVARPATEPGWISQIHFTAWLLLMYVDGMILLCIAAWHRMRSIQKFESGDPTTSTISAERIEAFHRVSREALAAVSLKRVPRFIVSPKASVPFSAGILRPIVVVPSDSLASLDEEELRTVLLHELVHHKRGDLWMSWAQFYVSLVWWFHPVMWLVNRAIRNVREDCCDDVLLSRSFVPANEYCRTILKVADGTRGGFRALLLPAASMADRHPLAERITRIMDSRIRRADRLGIAGIVTVVVVGCLILPGLTQPKERAAVPETAPTAIVNANSEAGASTSVKGGVVDSSGSPVEGATIMFSVKNGWEHSFEGPPVIAEAHSASDGTFTLTIPKSTLDGFVKNRHTKFQCWVYKPGLAIVRKSNDGSIPESPLEIRLTSNPNVKLQILNPDGSPCSGAMVSIGAAQFADDGYATIPDSVRKLAARPTDNAGRVGLVGIDCQKANTIEISKRELGRQSFRFGAEGRPLPEKLTLRAVGAIEGRLTLPDQSSAVDLSKVQVNIHTLNKENPSQTFYWAGVSSVQPDRGGSFRIPEIAEGKVYVEITEPEELGYRAAPREGLVVTPGETSKLFIPMQSTVKVTRRILDMKTKHPIEGVRVHLQNNQQFVTARTNSEGKFVAQILPETNYYTGYDIPDGYIYRNIDLSGSTRVPAGAGVHELTPVEFLRGRSIGGVVLDAAGKPFADVQVGANWNDPAETYGESEMNAVNARAWGKTDAAGKFHIDGVHPDVDVTVIPVRAGVRLGQSKTVTATQTEPMTLETFPFDFVSLGGRVVDENQKPLAGVKVKVLVGSGENDRDSWNYATTQVTDAVGHFATPAHLPRKMSYRASVRPDWDEVATSPWLHPEKEGTTFADIKVERAKALPYQDDSELSKTEITTLKRTVVDASGKPVAGAEVIAWYLADRVTRQSESDGSFVFRNVPATGLWVFVKADGFRFYGGYVQPSAEPERITLIRTTESAKQQLKPAPAKVAEPNVIKYAQTEFAKFVELVLKSNDDQISYRKTGIHEMLAKLDPDAAVKLLGDGIDLDDRHVFRVRLQSAKSLAATDRKRAMEILALTTNPDFRCEGLMEFAHEQPVAERGKLLEEVVKLAAKTPAAQLRVTRFARIGTYFREMGNDARARELMNQAMGEASKLANDERDSFTRGFVAWQMAPLDYQSTLKLLPIPAAGFDRDQTRYFGNIAHQIAATKPAESERLLGLLKLPSSSREGKLDLPVRVCYRMAPVDLPRAERIAKEYPTNKLISAYALGMIAQSAENAERAHRTKLLEEAYDILESEVSRGSTTIYHPLTIAVGLLPVVEQVVPDRFEEFFWRALSLRNNISIGMESRALGKYGPGDTMRIADPLLGACLARYDGGTGQLLSTTPGDQTLDLGYFDAPFFLLGSLVIFDPETAVRAAAKLPTETGRDLRGKYEAWSQVLAMFGKTTAERWDYLVGRHYLLWRPDTVDF